MSSGEDRIAILDAATKAVMSDRNEAYGDPTDNFQDTAKLWNAHVGHDAFTRADVAIMLILVKIARLRTSPTKDDHWVDIAGYAACGWPCAKKDHSEET